MTNQRKVMKDKRHLLKVSGLFISPNKALEFLGPYFLASNRNLKSPLSQILFEKVPLLTGA
jgi:hypothetical protein